MFLGEARHLQAVQGSGGALLRRHGGRQSRQKFRVFLGQVLPPPIGGIGARLERAELYAVGALLGRRLRGALGYSLRLGGGRRGGGSGSCRGSSGAGGAGGGGTTGRIGGFRSGGRRVRRCLGEGEVLHADTRFFRPLSVGILLQERLIGLLSVGVARLLPVVFFVELLDARLRLRSELARRIFLQEQLIGVRGVRRPGLFPIALLAAAGAESEQQCQTET